jgi:hypothetical protein
MSTLPTVGEIARRTGEPVHRIEYLIRSRRIIAQGKAGNVRVFSEEAVSQILAEVERLKTGRAGGEAA